MKQTHWQLLFDIARVAVIHHPVNSSAFRCDALDSRVHWCIPQFALFADRIAGKFPEILMMPKHPEFAGCIEKYS